MGIPSLNSAILYCVSLYFSVKSRKDIKSKPYPVTKRTYILVFAPMSLIRHQEDLHEVVEVAVEDALCIGSLVAGAKILDHLVGMQDVAADLRAPFYLFLLAFQF